MNEEQVTLDNCEREPIHIPGAIQPHGALVACRATDLAIVQISANAPAFFGEPAETLLGRPVSALFGHGHTVSLAALANRNSFRDVNPIVMVSISGVPLDVIVHRSADLMVFEVERRFVEDGATFAPHLRRAVARLQDAARTFDELTDTAAREVRELTGFDRVMVYRFDHSWNGQVVAEARREGLETFLGQHYPSSDIPAQARRLYTQNWLRLIGDASYTPVPLVPPLDPSGRPLDMSSAHLRSVSPIHIEYLKNMGVSASMSISLVSDGELIGLIACHHYSGPRLVSYLVRETAEYLGQALSWNLRVLDRAEEAIRIARVQRSEAEVAKSLAGAEELLDGLVVPALVSLADATGVAVVLQEGTRLLGRTPSAAQVEQLVKWLATRTEDMFSTDHLGESVPEATAWDEVGAGLLAATVSRELGEYILWFRPSTERSIEWAGNPTKRWVDDPTGATPPRLSPRGSFELWRETVKGRSLPWEKWSIAAASDVRRLLVGGARRRTATLRTLNERLLEADRAKDTFIATVSHELRTPLNAISGWSRLLLGGTVPEGRRMEALKVISRNTDALARLVDDLLDVSRIVSGKVTLDVGLVDVASVFESVVESMALAAEGKAIRVKRVFASGLGGILGDEARLRQIMTNLLSNAIKFTPKDGSIVISVMTRESDIEFAVQDSGPGIDPEVMPRVFDPFWQVDGTAKRQSGGLGLGLAIAKKLVELHGGRITAESAGLGFGATFRVYLPISSARPAPAEKRAAALDPIPRVLDGLQVVVAEDDDDSRSLLQQILENAGAIVSAAPNAMEALALLEVRAYDMIVSDVGMPEMDGLELIAAVRGNAAGQNAKTPAIALTAYTRMLDRTSALRAGFQAHVPKPADPEELVTVIASLARRL